MQGLRVSFLLILASCIHVHALKSQRVTLTRKDVDKLVQVDTLARDSGRNNFARSIYPCHGLECAEKYVALEDPNFSWRVMPRRLSGTVNGVTWEATLLNMTSQQWMAKGETNHELWWHILAIITPSNHGMLGEDSVHWATLFVTGGSRTLGVSADEEQMRAAAHMAALTGTTSVVVYQVPNQPLSFADDPVHAEKQEEAMKAWGWRRFFEVPEHPEHAIELPIAKALVRALDTVTEFTSNRVQSFAITGFSKRGVGSWMTAALDKRVKAIMPGCHDMDLSSLNHDLPRSYGHDTIATQDYSNLNISDFVDRPEMEALFAIVDPSTSEEYLKRLEGVDKFFMAAGNDDFFMVDQAKHWLHLIKGPFTYMMSPNKPHLSLMTQGDFLIPAAAFLQSTITKTPMPKISWEVNESGAITVHQVSNHKPLSVRVWHADTCVAAGMRDFRTVTGYKGWTCMQCGIPYAKDRCKVTRTIWRSADLPLSDGSDGKTWVAWMPPPKDGGWRAFFVEFGYLQPSRPEPWVITTEASVVPRTYPFPDCVGKSCPHDMLVLAQMS